MKSSAPIWLAVGVLWLMGCQQSTPESGVTAGSEAAGTTAVETTAATSGPPYAVGSSTFFIHDESRPFDSVAGVDTGMRTLVTELWYPVAKDAVDGYKKATYGDYVFGNRAVHQMMMTQTTFFHLTPESVREGVDQETIDAGIEELFTRERDSYTDAPLAQSTSPFPVVVMTHGDAGSRYNMETVCEYLAAHGYVVIAPEHTGNSPFAMTGADPALAADGDPDFRDRMSGVLELLDENGVYGNIETYGQSYTPLATGRESPEFAVNLDASLLQRLGDLRAALAELDRLQAEGRFAGRLNLDRIGLVGRSFGGATTLLGLGMEPRFTAGFSVVPPGYLDLRSTIPKQFLVPAGEESVLLSDGGGFPLGEFTKPTFLLSGAEDHLIIGLGADGAQMLGLPAPSAASPHPVLRAAYEASEAPVIWGMLADSNHSSLGVSGTYWWPELKPDTMARYFEEGAEFKLIDVELAHLIQKTKALAFFDLTIREDKTARDRLLDQSWADAGLALEAKNL